ncbi:MAG TPA: hypothetical protein VGM41_21000 [Chitinophagaceae bacterium]|jgi:hypothetical protein
MQQKISPLKALRFLHKAMMLGMLLFTVIVIFVVLQHPGAAIDPSLGKTLQVVALVLSVGGTAAGFMLFKSKLQSIDLADTAENRITAYRKAAIIRWALIEAPVLFSIICLKMTGNYAFLALALALLFVFGAVRPSTQVIMFQLKLTEAEMSELENVSE